ncbi:MAG: sigma-70 family RNA polymerase sigma factor [Phycisphaera sp.]|nr:sigma-70 family RNA polymerase sigma factor [Phycisphaera sp.]
MNEFVKQLIDVQPQMYSFVLSLTADATATADIVQEANVVMWEKRDDFTPGTEFRAWAFTIARWQAMAHFKRVKRQRMVFSDDVIRKLEQTVSETADSVPTALAALQSCLEKLTPHQREILDVRYGNDRSVVDAAAALKRPVQSLYQALYRIRQLLTDCINGELTT